ncbi:hypothetical protein Tco_0140859, partial [Tanacetum coccineum]
MSNNNLQTNTSSALHNAIMGAGGKDRLPMLAPCNYALWKSRIKRYIDTKPNHELIHYSLENPPYKYQWIPNLNPNTPSTPGIDGATPIRPARVIETYEIVSDEIKKKMDAEVEAAQIILTRIDNDIYSTVDACSNAMECGKQLKGWNKNQDLKNVSYHKLYYVLKQHHNEVNEIKVERLARNANPLALVVATQQPVYHPQPKPTHYTQSSSTRSQAATRNKGKEIANTPSTKYDSEPKASNDEGATPRDKEIEELMALISMSFKKIYKPTNNNLKTSSNTKNKNIDNTLRPDRRIWYGRQTGQYENLRAVNVVGVRENVGTRVVRQIGIQCFNYKEFGHVAKECKKAKQVRDLTCHKEKMLMCKQEEARIQMRAKQVDWRDEKYDELEDATDNSNLSLILSHWKRFHNNDDNYNVLTNERHHLEKPESINNTYVMEKDDRNITRDSSDMSDNGEEADQDNDLAKERDLLASLIEKLKREIDDSKKSLESSKKAFKEANKSFEEANTSLANEIDKYQIELDMYQNMNYVKDAELECCYNDNLALMLAPDTDKTIRLAQESRSKLISPEIKIVIELKMSPVVDDLATNVQLAAEGRLCILASCQFRFPI